MKISNLFKIRDTDSLLCFSCGNLFRKVKHRYIYQFICDCKNSRAALLGSNETGLVNTISAYTKTYRVQIYTHTYDIFSRYDSKIQLNFAEDNKALLDIDIKDITEEFVKMLIAFQ